MLGNSEMLRDQESRIKIKIKVQETLQFSLQRRARPSMVEPEDLLKTVSPAASLMARAEWVHGLPPSLEFIFTFFIL